MRHYLIIIFLFFCALASAQDEFTISGVVKEANTQEVLPGVEVNVSGDGQAVVTDLSGAYSLTLPQGEYEIVFSQVGLKTEKIDLSLFEDRERNISMYTNTETLDEVLVQANEEKTKIRSPQMSVMKITSNTIKKIPVVLGETDILKSITLLPGVSDAGEGVGGFNVRGGADDQNLILLDNTTLYNSSHLFGFFSIFNPDAVNDLTLYKGAIPARYGGRIASVLDIRQKTGNKQHFKATGGVSPISSRAVFEGPLKKDKASFLVGGRSSYAHLFLPLFNNDNTAFFYDLNTKLDYKVNANNQLFLSGYFGRDVFKIADNFYNDFGNALLNLRWRHKFSDRLGADLSVIYSDYNFGLELKFLEFKYKTNIRNFNLKYDVQQKLSDHLALNYGVNSIHYKINPGDIAPTAATSSVNPVKLTDKYALENGVYADAEMKIGEHLNLQAGARLSMFNRLGQSELNVYKDNNPVLYNNELEIYEKAEPVKTVSYKSTEAMETFVNLEPRMSASFAFNEDISVKASYTRMAQYIHLISNTSAPTPFDVYAPSGKYIKPQLSDQYAVGYFRNVKDYSIEIESFFKTGKNRLDYVDGADLIANNAIEQILLSGETRAYGAEFLLKKNVGRLQGWLAYTLAKSEQRTPGRTPEEHGINNGNWYPTAWDKRHDVSLTAQYKLSDRWSFGANLIFQTGRPTTYPEGQYVYQGMVIPVYEERHSSRLTAYHRLDLSATLTPKSQSSKRWKGEWVFSIYNVYNRKNAASITFRKNEDHYYNEAVRLSIFGIIPSVTYNFKF